MDNAEIIKRELLKAIKETGIDGEVSLSEMPFTSSPDAERYRVGIVNIYGKFQIAALDLKEKRAIGLFGEAETDTPTQDLHASIRDAYIMVAVREEIDQGNFNMGAGFDHFLETRVHRVMNKWMSMPEVKKRAATDQWDFSAYSQKEKN